MFADVSTKSKPDPQFWSWKRMLSEGFRTRCFLLSGSRYPTQRVRSWNGTRPAECSSRLPSFRDVYVIYFFVPSGPRTADGNSSLRCCCLTTSRQSMGERLQTRFSDGISANTLPSGSARVKGPSVA